MRTPNLQCLLCKDELATKKESHIISKFITKGILGSTNQKKAYVINAAGQIISSVQDTIKEDYILCPSCEKYFEHLETYVSKEFYHKFWDDKYQLDFHIQHQKDFQLKLCNRVNPNIFRLFLNSIIWRCSISSDKACENFQLKQEEEEILRKILLKHKKLKYKELFSIPSANIPKYNIKLCTTIKRLDNENNVIVCDSFLKMILFNEFLLTFSFEEITYIPDLIMIGTVTLDSWNKLLLTLGEAWGKRQAQINH
jgi:hypothetical protein